MAAARFLSALCMSPSLCPHTYGIMYVRHRHQNEKSKNNWNRMDEISAPNGSSIRPSVGHQYAGTRDTPHPSFTLDPTKRCRGGGGAHRARGYRPTVAANYGMPPGVPCQTTHTGLQPRLYASRAERRRTFGSEEPYEGCDGGGDVLCGRATAAAGGSGGVGVGSSRQPDPRRSSEKANTKQNKGQDNRVQRTN